MATKLENLNLEIAHWHQVKHHIPGHESWDAGTVMKLLDLGLIQVSTGFEYAVAAIGGHTVVSTNAADISDGSDGKLSTVRTSNYGNSYSAPVKKISGKTGDLRVQVYERKQNAFYYFSIPYNAYKHIPRTSNIEIRFELDGKPRRVNNSVVNWWEYECSDIVTMSLGIHLKQPALV